MPPVPSLFRNPSAVPPTTYPLRCGVGVDVARERLARDGAPSMSSAELVAVLVDADTRRKAEAEEAGRRLMALCGWEVRRLLDVTEEELTTAAPGIKRRTLGRILAAVELGRRVAEEAERRPAAVITGTASAVAFCRRHFARLATDGVQEEFHIVTVDTRHRVIRTPPHHGGHAGREPRAPPGRCSARRCGTPPPASCWCTTTPAATRAPAPRTTPLPGGWRPRAGRWASTCSTT